jgi:hypothetical protein
MLKRKTTLRAKNVLLLPKEDAGHHNLIVRMQGVHINSFFRRREPVVICNPHNGERIIRYAMGGGSLPGIKRDSIALDYDGLITLGFEMKQAQPCDLIVRKARPFETYLFFTRHPDLGIQLSIKLGLTGVFLGMLGLALGVVSLI